MDEGFGHWFAGFVDGEGCFLIATMSGGRCYCRFQIKVRADERGTLVDIQTRTGLGNITSHSREKIGKPQSRYEVQRRGECLDLVRLLDRYPLRAKKARDFRVWRKAVLAWQDITLEGRSDGSNSEVWARMAACQQQLNTGRKYSGPE